MIGAQLCMNDRRLHRQMDLFAGLVSSADGRWIQREQLRRTPVPDASDAVLRVRRLRSHQGRSRQLGQNALVRVGSTRTV